MRRPVHFVVLFLLLVRSWSAVAMATMPVQAFAPPGTMQHAIENIAASAVPACAKAVFSHDISTTTFHERAAQRSVPTVHFSACTSIGADHATDADTHRHGHDGHDHDTHAAPTLPVEQITATIHARPVDLSAHPGESGHADHNDHNDHTLPCAGHCDMCHGLSAPVVPTVLQFRLPRQTLLGNPSHCFTSADGAAHFKPPIS